MKILIIYLTSLVYSLFPILNHSLFIDYTLHRQIKIQKYIKRYIKKRNISKPKTIEDKIKSNCLFSFPIAKKYKINSLYGHRRHPIEMKYVMHYGIDIECDLKNPIRACCSGKVINTKWHKEFGKIIEIKHLNNIISLYGQSLKIWQNMPLVNFLKEGL